MSIFRRKVKPSKKPIDKRSIVEILETVTHCSAINKNTIVEYESSLPKKILPQNSGILKDGVWLNPSNQTAFNYGNFTKEEFIEWAKGTGPIVKGESQEIKDRFMRYAKAYNELDLNIFIYAKYLWMIDEDSETEINYGRYSGRTVKKPINMSRRQESHDVIKKVLSYYVRPVYRDIKDAIEWGRGIEDVSKKTKDFMYAALKTVALSGHGYYEACNTPTELENLSWSCDLVFAKAYSMYLEEIDPGIVDCIIWCQKNSHKHGN